MQKFRVGATILIPTLLFTVLLWLMQPVQPVESQATTTNFDNVTLSGNIVAGGDGTFGGNLSVAGVLAAAEFITGNGDVVIPGSLVITDDLTVTDDSTLSGDLTVSGATVLVGTVDVQGNLSDSGGVFTVVDNVMIDGAADAVQLTVQGNATNTNLLFVVENSGGTDQFSVGNTGDATIADDLTVTDDAAVNDLTVADFVNVTAQAGITLVNGATLTPTGSLQPVTSVAAAGVSGADIVHTTDYLILVNIGAQTITFTETTGLISAGNIALGAGDVSTLVWANDGWIEIARSNN